MIYRQTMQNFVGQWSHVKQWQKICTETLKNVFSNTKKWLEETYSGTVSARIFSCFVLSNHTVFLVQFEINLHLWVFQKAHSCKLIPNWTRNRVITYTKQTSLCVPSKNGIQKAEFSLKAVLTSLNKALVPISRSRFKQRQFSPFRTFNQCFAVCVYFWVIFGHYG